MNNGSNNGTDVLAALMMIVWVPLWFSTVLALPIAVLTALYRLVS